MAVTGEREASAFFMSDELVVAAGADGADDCGLDIDGAAAAGTDVGVW